MLTPTDIAARWRSPHREEPLDGFIAPEDRGWSRIDGESCEVECGDLLWGLVRYLKPLVVVETGTYLGFASACIALALQQNKQGHLYTIDIDQSFLNRANQFFKALGLDEHITTVCGDSMSDDLTSILPGKIDLLLVDGGNRPGEHAKYTEFLSEHGMALMHDALKMVDIYNYASEKGMKFFWAGRGLSIQ